MDTNLFTHGQLYTALSRVSDKYSIKIMTEKKEINGISVFYVNNVVYKEILILKKIEIFY